MSFTFLILFFVFQVNANQCNEELVKDFPLTLRSSKDLSPDELKKFIQGVDAQLFLRMDENVNLYLEEKRIFSTNIGIVNHLRIRINLKKIK